MDAPAGLLAADPLALARAGARVAGRGGLPAAHPLAPAGGGGKAPVDGRAPLGDTQGRAGGDALGEGGGDARREGAVIGTLARDSRTRQNSLPARGNRVG